jgi:hypothetical protein
MTIRSTFEPLSVATMLGDVSVSGQRAAAAQYAAAAIAETDAINRRVLGRVPPAAVSVDGRLGAPLASVRLNGGVILADWAIVGDVLVWIGRTLQDRSPIVSGRYRDAHTLFADAVEVEIGKDVPPASQYVFLNPVPYAHKIEIGKTKSGRDFVVQVPNRIYERTADEANARFGNVASIRFSYRAPLDGALLKYVPVRGPASRAASAIERELRVPSIIVTLRSN